MSAFIMDMLNKGDKHTCSNCEARFFDLLKLTAQCPKCGTVDQTKTGLEAALEAALEALDADAPALIPTNPDADIVLDLESVETLEDEDEDEEDDLMEDTSDLGRLEDDVREVLDHVETPERAET